MQFAPTQIASSPRTAGRSSRRRVETPSRQLALFGEGTRTLPLGSAQPAQLEQPAKLEQPAQFAQQVGARLPASPVKRLVLDTAPAAAVAAVPAVLPAGTPAGVPAGGRGATRPHPIPRFPVQVLSAHPVGSVAAVVPLPVPAGDEARTLGAEDEVWQPMSGVQKLLEIGGAGLLMVACVALAIFW